MILKLTIWQKIEHYIIVAFALLPILFDIYYIIKEHGFQDFHTIDYSDYITTFAVFGTLSVFLFFIRRTQLKFREFEINTSSSDFKKAIEVTSEQMEWIIENQTDTYLQAYRQRDFLGSELITIYRESNKIFINCIPNPNYKSSIITFGLRKGHINTFISNLNKIKRGESTIESPHRWNFADYLIRIIGYSFCLLFIFLSIFVLIPAKEYFIGILIGLIGIGILAIDIKKQIKKNVSR